MNSRWKRNLIIFAMVLEPTRSNSRIKIRVYGTPRVNVGSNLVKVDKLGLSGLSLMQKHEKCCLKRILILFEFWLTQGLLGAFWSILPKMALWVLWCPNGLHHINLDVSIAQWRNDNIFLEISGSGTQIEDGKNMLSTIMLGLVMMLVLGEFHCLLGLVSYAWSRNNCQFYGQISDGSGNIHWGSK